MPNKHATLPILFLKGNVRRNNISKRKELLLIVLVENHD